MNIKATWTQPPPETTSIYVRDVSFERFPSMAELPKLIEANFEGCRFEDFPTELFQAPRPLLRLKLNDCLADWDALFRWVLVHGVGSIRLSFRWDPSNTQRFRIVNKLGQDHAGDEVLREKAWRLMAGEDLGAPSLEDLPLLNWSKKPVRLRAHAWLAAAWPRTELVDDSVLWIVGKPSLHKPAELRERLSELGWKTGRKPGKATHAVLQDRPGASLQKVLDAGLPLIWEQQLKDRLDARCAPGIELNDSQGEGLAQMLGSNDPGTVAQALHLLQSVEFSAELLPNLILAMMFCPDNGVRRDARLALYTHAPQAVADRFRLDDSRWHAVSSASRLRKITKELATLGVDPGAFATGLCRHFAPRRIVNTHDLLGLACTYAEDPREAFTAFAKYRRLQLKLRGELPESVDELPELIEMTLQGRLKKPATALARLPKLFSLTLDTRTIDLTHYASVAPRIEYLTLYRGLKTEPLRAWSSLKSLRLYSCVVDDDAPLAALPALEELDLRRTTLPEGWRERLARPGLTIQAWP